MLRLIEQQMYDEILTIRKNIFILFYHYKKKGKKEKKDVNNGIKKL